MNTATRDITLCAIDTRNPLHALRALDLSRRQFPCADTLFLTDGADDYTLPGCRIERIAPFAERADYSRFVIKGLLDHIRTRHVLLIQWDGYVVNARAWRDDFLDYDYIGAPWGWHQDAYRVGNGGFSLRSRRLLEALRDPEIDPADPEDETICRRYRPLLEQRHGIRYAPEDLAAQFSFEGTYPQGLPFGFHGLFNLWAFLPARELEDFIARLDPATVRGPQMLRLAQNYAELHRTDEARCVLRYRLAVAPDDAAARELLARLPAAGGTPAAAPAATPQARAAALLGTAMQHHQAGRLYDAQALYQQVLQIEPANAVAIQYLGVLAMQAGQPQAGEAMIRRALALRPDLPDFHNNLGLCLRLQDKLDDAMAAYRAALALAPGYVEAMNNLGLDLQASGRVDEAAAQFEQAVALKPDFAQAHWNLGLAHLVRGDLQRGWPEYEWRARCLPTTPADQQTAHLPRWRGEDLAGRTLVLREEQGAGDTLQFIRYAAVLAERGARIVALAGPALAELVATATGVTQVVTDPAALPAADFQCKLLSVPAVLGTTLATVPARVPYLSADPARAAAWRAMVEARAGSTAGMRVGLVWAGNPKHTNDRNRSCPLSALAPWFALPGIAWFSLQKGDAAGQLAAQPEARAVHDLGSELESFADTAAAIAALDLVITVDTSVAHVAGALGRPVWVLLPFAPDWRWLLERDDSPWYPTMQLIRQRTRGDWAEVASRVAAELAPTACETP